MIQAGALLRFAALLAPAVRDALAGSRGRPYHELGSNPKIVKERPSWIRTPVSGAHDMPQFLFVRVSFAKIASGNASRLSKR
jgi:hypothetical protein